MSFWRKLFGVEEPEARAPAPRPHPPRPVPLPQPRGEPLALLTLRALTKGDPILLDEALFALGSLRGGVWERAALLEVGRAARRGVAMEPLLVAAAELLLQRGEAEAALGLLERVSGVSGLLVRSEALAARGQLGAAAAALERVLAQDIGAPGVRERLERFRARLGAPPAGPAGPSQEATLFAAARPSAPFRILSEAGRGGTAVVYEAEDELLGRRVALKVYHRPETSREQIEREACLAVRVAGPAVVRVFDADFRAGWLSLEWAGGGTLRDALGRRDLGLLLPAASWLGPLLESLARVHDEGVAHGDIKPGNVLFRASHAPLLADFGLARPVGEAFSGGTIGYLSPERLAGEAAALTDDVYAVGRTLEDVLRVTGEDDPSLADLVTLCLGEGRPAAARALLSHPALARSPLGP